MRVSRFLLSTLKEAPAEAELVSQRLMLRAGMIKRLAAGIYTWMPLGLRVLRKVEAIVREEMNRAGAIELLMPVVQPAELWQETGRWDKYGPELLRLKDRHERDFIVRPTHEEVITDIARKEIRSYKQLPVNLYQIQTKFRDEIRPRFGVMRSREFVMKDAYSFDVDKAAMLKSYQAMYDAYARIFTRMGLKFRAVAADTGQIGGSASHEFQVLADSGEDAIAWCPASDYAANVELAEARRARAVASRACRADAEGAHARQGDLRGGRAAARRCRWRAPSSASCSPPRSRTSRAHPHAARPRRSHGQRSQGRQAAGARTVAAGRPRRRSSRRPAASRATSARSAFRADLPLIVDRTVAVMADFVCGANEPDFHLRGVNFGRDCREPDRVADLRNVVDGDPSPDGKGTLEILRGIEVGHVFALGDLYSKAHGRNLSRRRRSIAGHGDGLLRDRGHPRRRRGDRAEPRRARVSSGRSRWPLSPWPSPRSATIATRRSRRSPTGSTTSSRRPASKCCSTTAASVLA